MMKQLFRKAKADNQKGSSAPSAKPKAKEPAQVNKQMPPL